MTIELNGVIPCTSAHLFMPAIGCWVADLEVDFDVVPPGPSVLTIGLSTLAGKIDPRGTGSVGPTGHARLVGGLGWSQRVQALHIHNDAGVLLSAVLQATAAEVLEVVVAPIPKVLGVDFVRSAGPASRVLSGFEWHVDPSGVTMVGPRAPIPAGPNIEILNWDPEQKIADLACTELVLPGTVLTDPRFGVAVVCDVEQTFTAESGARAKAWCQLADEAAAAAADALVKPVGLGGLKLVRMIAGLAKEAVGLPYLRRHEYRVVLVGPDGRLVLQAVDLFGDMPLFLPLVEVWPGIAGASCKPLPGSIVTVVFTAGDPSMPKVVDFDPSNPPALETKLDAVRIALGTLALEPVAKAPSTVAAAAALQAQFAALGVWLAANTATSFSAVGMLATSPALIAAIGGGTAAVTAAALLIPSPKTFTD